MASLSERILFEEKQYLGHNKTSTIIRLTIATFCFVAYYWSENPKPISIGAINIGWYPAYNIPNSGKIFFVLGILVLILSAFLINVQHLHTRVYHNSIIIDGFWTSRRVKIDLRNIHTVKKLRYKKNTLRRTVYNLHVKGKKKSFTRA